MIAYNTNSEDGYVMTSIDWVAGRRENEEGFLEGGFGSKRLVGGWLMSDRLSWVGSHGRDMFGRCSTYHQTASIVSNLLISL